MVYTAALFMPSRVKAVADHYRGIAKHAESINVFSPFAFFSLRKLRGEAKERTEEAEGLLAECLARMTEPVEGMTAAELSWIQGFTFAAGMSAFTELEHAFSAASATLDRKSSYAFAAFSLYVGVFLAGASVL
ncbi:hypothetical protein [Microcoleus sp. AT13-A5]|uniref:hypothetical protein n=1 Tax=Microcoleus sp. AT13-A5 TaxID=2818590 RepID=UPI002FD73EC7